MNSKLYALLRACDTVHQVDKELEGKPFIFNIRKIRSSKKSKEKLQEVIDSFYDDKWTVSYLYDIERTMLVFLKDLEPYFVDFYISGIKDVGKEPVGMSPFHTMYFEDRLRDRIISLDIIAENINFAIMDTKTGNSFMVSSSNEVSESQHKIEEFCKRIFVDFLSDYLKGVPYDPTFGYGTKEDDK